ncbi:MAG: GTPase KRas precursor [Candidatus Heimdallarchaeota archaeon LC_2]|nr:MAG: GTPase KRas precursor [Candidatus Heimdallarchaeota archaeon LC_2]
MASNDKTWTLKIVILGEPSVGKTSLRRSYLGENFEENYLSTIGADFSYKQTLLPEGKVNSALWDLAGQILFRQVNPQYFRGAAGAMVVYDVCNEVSFNRVVEWVQKYLQHSGNHDGPILIIGNKTDLLIGENTKEDAEIKHAELLDRLRKDFPNISEFLSFMTSAKTASWVSDSFTQLVKSIIGWQLSISDQPIKIPEMSDIWNYLPTGYLIGSHDFYGPKMIGKVSKNNNSGFTNQELSSGIKASTLLDYNKISSIKNLVGTFPWTDPSGSFHYIAFVLDNSVIKANNALYLVGFVSDRGIGDVVSSNLNIIEGYLHQAMNDTIHYLLALDVEIFTSTNITLDLKSGLEKTTTILTNLRENIFKNIRTKIRL